LRGDFFCAEVDRRKLRVVGIAGEIVELVTQHVAVARQLVLRHQGAVALDLENVGKNLGEDAEFPGQAGDLLEPLRSCTAPHRLIDGVLQGGFGAQRCLGVIFLSGHHVVARQRPVRSQFAVDIAGQVGFRHAVAVGRNGGRNPLESKIGDAHAGCRGCQYDGKAEEHFAAKSQGRKFCR
jgi:hypothetical protein